MNSISKKYGIVGMGVGVILMTLFLQGAHAKMQTQEQKEYTQTVEVFIPVSTTTVPIEVSGVVTSTDTVTMYARTAGVLSTVYVQEGDRVDEGSSLFVQDTPVIDSSIALAVAQKNLQAVTTQAQYSAQSRAAQQATASAQTTQESVQLQEAVFTHTQQKAYDDLRLTLVDSVTQLVLVLDFIDTNRTLLSNTASDRFIDVLSLLYGGQPSYLNDGIVHRVSQQGTILSDIDSLSTSTKATQALVLSDALLQQIQTTLDILVDSEGNFLDHSQVTPSGTLYTQYISHRTALSQLLSTVQNVQSNVFITLPKEEQTYIVSELNAFTAASQAEEALSQLSYAADTVEKTNQLNDAQIALWQSQKDLAHARAPFDARVKEVFVDAGQYVEPGTPILTLDGVGGVELEVTVPMGLLPLLQEGQSFSVDGEVVGYVQRFAPALHNGAVKVFITLKQGLYTVGQSITGSVALNGQHDALIAVPRSYLFFSTHGPYILLEDGVEIPVSVVYDAMSWVYLSANEPITKGLVPTMGISL